MYKRPSKRAETVRLVLLYTFMTAVILVLVTILVLVVANYRFNKATGTFEQSGLLQLASTPSGADVRVDGMSIGQRTSTKYSIDPGEHTIEIQKDQYVPWSKRITVSAGSLVWLNYARLVPNDRPIQPLNTYQSMSDSLASPDQKNIVMHFEKFSPDLRIVDISNKDPKGQTITIPESVYMESSLSDQDKEAARLTQSFELERWDESGRYLLVKYTRATQAQSNYLVIDTQDVAKSSNISREFSIPLSNIRFLGRSGNTLYAISENRLRKLDISGRTISRSLVDGIESFELYEDGDIAYTTTRDDRNRQSVGVYRDGDASANILQTTDQSSSLLISLTSYYDTRYAVIAEGKELSLYKGHYDKGMSGLEKVMSQTMPETITHVDFNQPGSYVLAQAGKTIMSYSIDYDTRTDWQLEGVPYESLQWADSMHVLYVKDGQLVIREVDGANASQLMTSDGNYIHAATLSKNGTYMYGISYESNRYQLQRIRMILE